MPPQLKLKNMRQTKNMRAMLIVALLLVGFAHVFAQSSQISANAFPAAAVADGHSTITIKARIVTSGGTPVADNTQVIFESDLGTFRDGGIATTKDGEAQATFVAGTTTGVATITIRATGLSIAPAKVTVELVLDREQLKTTKDYVEIVSQKPLAFSPADRKIQAEDLDHNVTLRYRDWQVSAEKLQLNLETYELVANKAVVKVGRTERKFASLYVHLDSKQGFGLTKVQESEVTGIASVGKIIILKSETSEHFGMAAINGTNVKAIHAIRLDNLFKIEDFDSPPALITARKAVVFRNKEIQFQQAELYAGTSRVMRLPLYRSPLTGDRRLFVDQILHVDDNQVALTYPYYLTLKPGETSYLRFHIGDQNSLFGASNRPQLDYGIDWERGAENYGGFLLGGLGQDSWGIEMHQYYRFDDRMTGFAQVETPAAHSVSGSMSLNRTLNSGYSASLSGSITQSLVGDPLTDQTASFLLQRDPMKIGSLPLRFSYGLTASHVSTTAPIAIQRQEAVGLQGQLTMVEQKLSPVTQFDSGITVSHLVGQNVDSGLTLGANAFIRTRYDNASFGFGYNFTQDPLQSLRVGQHMLTGVASYDKGNLILSLNGSTALDINNLQYTSSLRYRFKKLWSVAYASSFYRYLGSSFLDYNFGVYYSYLGSKQVGLIWSYKTNRLGLQLLGD